MSGTEILYGRNSVLETLRASRRSFEEVLIAEGLASDPRLDEIEKAARREGVKLREVPRRELDRLADHHQGVAVRASEFPYSSFGEILQAAAHSDQAPLLLILDSIQDPQNLGSLLRTAEAVGVDGILLPRRRAASVTAAVVSASSGASEHLPIARENLAASITTLKEEGYWVAGLERAAGAVRLDVADLSPPLAVVVGHEGQGLRRLVRERCDYLIEIPMRGRIGSLNAAIAGSLVLYQAWASRDFTRAR